MTIRDAVSLAAGNLRLSPLRTILTVLGLGVGVGAVLTVMTLGSAGEIRVEDEISRLGVDKVWINAEESAYPLSNTDAQSIAAFTNAPACAGVYTAGGVVLGDKAVLAQICGFDDSLEPVYHPVLTEGRLFTAREFRAGETVALADAVLQEALGGNVVGRRVDIGSRKVRIVGVVDGMAAQPMSGLTGLLVLPLNTFLSTWNMPVSEVTVSVPRGRRAGQVARAAVEALNGRPGSYRATTLEEEIDAARSVVRIFVMVLSCVAAVCVLTGAIGVMNILLVSVRERRREIGLIKAVGGRAGQVALLFLLEAAGYALLGGLLGLALGAVLIHACAWWIGLEAGLSASLALPAVALAGFVGLVFGVVPAVRAAGLKPVEALKKE